MHIEVFGIPFRPKRLLIVALPLAGVIAVAAIFLPSGVWRLAILGCLILPVGMVLFDRPRWIFYLIIFILFSTVDIFAPVRLHIYLVSFFVVSFAVALLNGRKIVYHDPTFIALVAAFMILAVQSLIFAGNPAIGVNRIYHFSVWLFNIAIAVQFVRSRIQFRNFLLVITIGIIVSNYLPFFVAVPQQYQSVSLIWTQGVLRYEGFVFEPNMFAGIQIFIIPVLLYFGLTFRKPFFARPLFLAAMGGSIFLLFLTFSRGGFVSIAFLLLLLLIVERKNKPVLVVGLLCIAGILILAPAVYWERIKSLLDVSSKVADDYAIASRMETMKVAVILGFKHPLFGVGIDNFLSQSSHYVPYRQTIHNPLLQVFSEMGVPGLLVLLAIIVHNFRLIARMMRRRGDPDASRLGRYLFLQQFIPVAYENILWFVLAMPSLASYAYRMSPAQPEAVQADHGGGMKSLRL